MSDYPLKDLDSQFTERDGVRMGLMFRCPHCRVYGSVFFKPLPAGFENYPSWEVSGDTLETLTLKPSVAMIGHFHSWITDGLLKVDSPFSCTKLPDEQIV